MERARERSRIIAAQPGMFAVEPEDAANLAVVLAESTGS